MAGHRSTLQKAKKPFKSSHATKRSIKAANKGKIEKTSLSSGPKTHKVQSKSDRKNLANQIKQNKVEKSLRERALFKNGKVERVVTFVPLTKNVEALEMANQVLNSVGEDLVLKEDVCVESIKVGRFKAHLKVILPDVTDLMAILDAAKVSDFIVMGLSATEEVDAEYGEQIIRALEAQGISSTYCLVPDVMAAYPGKRNLQQDVMNSLSSFYRHFFPDFDKLYMTEAPNDSINLLRNLCQKLPKSIRWRDERGYMVVDKVDTAPKADSVTEGYVVFEGTVRGTGFDVNSLVYLPDIGDFKVGKIELESESIVPDASQDTLDELLPLDEAMEEDYDDGDNDDEAVDLVDQDAAAAVAAKPKVLPKGLSEMQAKWLLEDEIESIAEEVGVEPVAEPVADESMDVELMEADDEPTESEIGLTPEQEAKELEEYKRRANDELEFPDEIEVTPDVHATEYLSSYRGVKSLANCVWNYDEESPLRPDNWLRYLRVKNYRATKTRILKEHKLDAAVGPGTRCKIYVEVPSQVLEKLWNPSVKPLALYALLPHEHKLSICQFDCQTWETNELPIESGETMYVQYGSRRVRVQPQFSQPSHNANNVTKFLRFLQVGFSGMATVVAPISFTNSPAIFYKKKPDGSIEILAQGTFVNSDYTRILAKRAVLTGEIYQIHKSVVTVRYMFFNNEDVVAYQKVPLFTKMGRAGLIKQSLGTHGYFKATFDGFLNPQDIVAMALYKRVWPANAV